MNNLLNLVGLLADESSSVATQNPTSSIWIYVILIGLVVVMLVLPMITQKKRNKEYQSMLDTLQVGDTIKTIGGIIGRVTKISEKDGQKSFLLETGAKGNKTTMEFDIASVAFIVSSSQKKVEEKVEEKEEQAGEETPETEQKKEEKPQNAKPKKKTTKKSNKK